MLLADITLCCNNLVSHTDTLREDLIVESIINQITVIYSVDRVLGLGTGMFVDMNYDTFGGMI